MPSGYTVNGKDLDDLFKPIIGTKIADVGYGVVTSTSPYTVQDLSSRYEASRKPIDRLATATGFKNSSGVDLRDLFMSKDYVIIPITYTITADKNLINETTDKTVTFTFKTTGIDDGTVFYVSLTRTDLSLNKTTITTVNESATFTATALADLATEGYQTFEAKVRIGSQTGTVVATSNLIGITDTSIKPVPTYSITPSKSSIDEGGSVTFKINTTNVPVGTRLYWKLSRNDLTPDNGSYLVKSTGLEEFTVTANADSTAEGSQTFTATLHSDSINGAILDTSSAVTINDTSVPVPTYSISPSKSSIDEGGSVTFNVTTTHVANGTRLFFSLSRTDLSFASNSFTVSDGKGSFTVTADADATTEGDKTFTASLRSGSVSGTILITSSAVTIKDTSVTPVPKYTITPTKSSIDEGGSVAFDVTTENVAIGTKLYWSVSRTDLTPSSGSITISGATSSFTVTADADATTEGDKTFTASLRSESVSGSILVTSSAVTIKDTSVTPPNYKIGLRVDVYRDVGTAAGSLLVGYNRGKKGGFVRVLISRDSVLQYGADGKCNVSVSFTNASFENIKNWNTTLSITQDQLLNSNPNTIKGIVFGGEAGYYDITGVLPVPSRAGWQETRNCIPAGSTTTITLKDTLAGTTKSGSVGTHSNGLTGQAYPKYF